MPNTTLTVLGTDDAGQGVFGQALARLLGEELAIV
jgi:hypothetical protein